MSSRDDILTEGDETGGDELRDEGVRARLDSRASQVRIRVIPYRVTFVIVSSLVDRHSVVQLRFLSGIKLDIVLVERVRMRMESGRALNLLRIDGPILRS